MLKQNTKQFFQLVHNNWFITYRLSSIHVCKLTIEILFEIWFDVDSYVQLRLVTVDNSKKTFKFAQKNKLGGPSLELLPRQF